MDKNTPLHSQANIRELKGLIDLALSSKAPSHYPDE